MLGDNFGDTVEVNVARKKIWRFEVQLSNKMAAIKGLTVLEKLQTSDLKIIQVCLLEDLQRITNALTNVCLQNVPYIFYGGFVEDSVNDDNVQLEDSIEVEVDSKNIHLFTTSIFLFTFSDPLYDCSIYLSKDTFQFREMLNLRSIQ